MTDAIDQAQALQALRLEIDGLDHELLTLLNRRAECALEVAVVKDATAGPRHPELGDGYLVALANFGFMANDVVTTADAVKAIKG